MDKIFKIGLLVLGVILLTVGCDDNFFETREQKMEREQAELLKIAGYESAEEPRDFADHLNKLFYKDFNEIKILDKEMTYVSISGDAKKVGLDAGELTDYLRLNVEKNFADIKLEDAPFDKYEPEQKGRIEMTVWIVGEDYPVVYYVRGKLRNFSSLNYMMWEDERLGFGAKDNVPDLIKKCIEHIIKDLAIDFFVVREGF